MPEGHFVSWASYLRYRLKRRFGCQHPGHVVVADILQGDHNGGSTALQWCRRCGAHRFVFNVYGDRRREDDWRIPSRWWER
jgi:hypothetical protein